MNGYRVSRHISFFIEGPQKVRGNVSVVQFDHL